MSCKGTASAVPKKHFDDVFLLRVSPAQGSQRATHKKLDSLVRFTQATATKPATN